MLTKKLPVEVSPPMLSIHWSVAWPDDKYAPIQKKTCVNCGKQIYKKKRFTSTFEKYLKDSCDCDDGPEYPNEDTQYLYDIVGMKEKNWIGARQIVYKGNVIRVFPDEFVKMDLNKMKFLIFDKNPSHDIVFGATASDELVEKYILEGDQRFVYDAALVDGCNHAQAIMTASEMDITIPDTEFPPLGWYICRKEYARCFCYDEDMEE